MAKRMSEEAVLKVLPELYKERRELARLASRADLKRRDQRIKQRGDLLDVLKDKEKVYADLTAQLEKAAAGDRDSVRDAITKTLTTISNNNTKLAQIQFTDVPALTDFEAQFDVDPFNAFQQLHGQFGEGEEYFKLALPSAFNQALERAFGDVEPPPTIDTPWETLDQLFQSRGLRAADRTKMQRLIQDAQDVSRNLKLTQEVNGDLQNMLGQLPSANDADLQRISKQAQDLLTRYAGAFDVVIEATPQQIEDMIALEKNDPLSPTNIFARIREIDAEISSLSDSPAVENDAARWIEDPFTKEWARTNGIDDLGNVVRDEEGNVTGIRYGGDYWKAINLWDYQSRNKNQWGRMFKPGGGQFTGQIVEMRPTVAMAAKVDEGEPGIIRFGNIHYIEQPNGTYEILPKNEVPAGLEYTVAVRDKGDGTYAPVTADDLKNPDLAQAVVRGMDDGSEDEELRALYDKPVVGIMESLHIGRAGEHGKGYRAVITAEGDRVVLPHADIRVIEDTEPKKDRAANRAARSVLKGRFPGLEKASAGVPRDDTPDAEVYGTRRYAGDATAADPEGLQRLKDMIAEQRTGELPLDSVIKRDKSGLLGFLRSRSRGEPGVTRDDVRRRAAARLPALDIEGLPERGEDLAPEKPVVTPDVAMRAAEALTEAGRRRAKAESPEPDYAAAERAGRADYAEKAAGVSPKVDVDEMDVATGAINLDDETTQGAGPPFVPEPEPKGELSPAEMKAEAKRRLDERRKQVSAGQ